MKEMKKEKEKKRKKKVGAALCNLAMLHVHKRCKVKEKERERQKNGIVEGRLSLLLSQFRVTDCEPSPVSSWLKDQAVAKFLSKEFRMAVSWSSSVLSAVIRDNPKSTK
jgi:hypothetical protein